MYLRVRCEKTLEERGSRTFATHEKHARRRWPFLRRCRIVEFETGMRRSVLLHPKTKKSLLLPIGLPLATHPAQVVSGGYFFHEPRKSGSRVHQERKTHRSSPLLLFEEVSFARADLDESSCESLKPFVKT